MILCGDFTEKGVADMFTLESNGLRPVAVE
jgi:hypothetical protein